MALGFLASTYLTKKQRGEKMRLSVRSIYTLCIAVPVLCVTSQPAFALLCTRYSLDHSGFVDIAAAAS